MRIIAHTKYGVFKSTETEYDEGEYAAMERFLERVNEYEYFSMETDEGAVYMSKGMIGDTLFVIEK